MKWLFGKTTLNRMDVCVLSFLVYFYGERQIEWWVAATAAIAWAVTSVVIELLIFGKDYYRRGKKPTR